MEIAIGRANPEDAREILALQKVAYQSEARLYDDWTIPPLTQTESQIEAEFESKVFLKAVSNGRIVWLSGHLWIATSVLSADLSFIQIFKETESERGYWRRLRHSSQVRSDLNFSRAARALTTSSSTEGSDTRCAARKICPQRCA
jgi:hypothetical protein